MANVIIPKKSSVASAVPTPAQLAVGEIAFNLADKKIYSKNAAGTIIEMGGGGGSASAAYTRTTATATASQTTFSVSYVVGYVDVWLNGIKLDPSEYTATSGTSVVLATGAAAGALFEAISWNVVPTVSVSDPENRVINGAFDFWQRGTSFTANPAYTADRWRGAGFNTPTFTTSRQSFAVGDTLGNNNPTFFLRQSVSGQTLASDGTVISQRIESVRSYAGETITVLGWARRSSGSGNIALEGQQNFGTGGTPSAAVTAIGVNTITLTTSWAPFAAVMSVPSITGKTLGTDGNDWFELRFWTSAGSDYNARTNSLGLQTIGVDLWGVHVKLGTYTTAATDLYTRPELGPELARCQRYYWAGLPATSLNFNSYTSNAIGSWAIMFPVTMRATPATSASLTGATLTQCTSLGFNVPTPNGARFILQSTAASINPNIAFAAGNLLIADAEL